MNCNSSEAQFTGLIEGTLPAPMRTAVLAHVDRCAACSSVLEELRVIDALLLAPREATLAPNFTFKIMAEVAAQPLPRPHRTPVAAFIVSYIVGAWMLVGLFALGAGPRAPAFIAAAQGQVGTLYAAVAGFSHVTGRGFSHGLGTLTALLGGVLVLDVMLALAVLVAYFVIRPRIAERIVASGGRS